jgi:small-conductance mechanosensitive channel
MTDISSARIIPFPRRPAAAEAQPDAPAASVPSHPPAMDNPTERLQRALAALERAVAAQREAVGQWRGALQGLRGNVESLRGSLTDYDKALGTLRGQVEQVNQNARGLEAWADGALEAAKARPDQPK